MARLKKCRVAENVSVAYNILTLPYDNLLRRKISDSSCIKPQINFFLIYKYGSRNFVKVRLYDPLRTKIILFLNEVPPA